MAKNYVKFPTAFFVLPAWKEKRKYSKAEAYLSLLNLEGDTSIRHLATRWQWAKTSVQRFIVELKQKGMWDTSWDTLWDTKRVDNESTAKIGGTLDGTLCGTHLIKENINPPILSSSKEESNIIPPKGETQPLNPEFIEFCYWLTEHAPRVAKMKEPFTAEQVARLNADFDKDFIHDLLVDMHNYEPLLKKYRSANRVFRKWAKMQKPTHYEQKPRTDNSGNDTSRLEAIYRAVADGISRASTPQEWES